MLGTGICQMYSLPDGYLVLTDQCQYVHQGGRFQDLCSSHINLIQWGINAVQLRMEYMEFFCCVNSQREVQTTKVLPPEYTVLCHLRALMQ